MGYAVNNIENAMESFSNLGFVKEDTQVDVNRKISIAFIRNGDTLVELIEPYGENSPVDEILKKNGPTPYHICYSVCDIDNALKELKKSGWVVILKKAPAPAMGDAMVAFLHNKPLGIIELVEEKAD